MDEDLTQFAQQRQSHPDIHGLLGGKAKTIGLSQGGVQKAARQNYIIWFFLKKIIYACQKNFNKLLSKKVLNVVINILIG